MKKILFIMSAVVLLAVGCNSETPPEQYAYPTMWCERPTTCNADVDVFYVVSTNIMHSYNPDGTESYTAVLTDEEKAILAKEIRNVKKDIFPDSLNFFSPYYHQNTMASTALPKEELAALAAKTKEEVFSAFDYYMAHYNQGRPFIVAGYSQGGYMTAQLLKHMTDEQYSRLVAAYVMGYGLSATLLESPHIKAATGAFDTGVTISFNSMNDPSKTWAGVQNDAVACINPVNWAIDETPVKFMYDGEELTAHVNTTVSALIVDGFHPEKHEIEQWEINPWPEGNYHNFEIIFYNPYIRQNALDRCRAFKK